MLHDGTFWTTDLWLFNPALSPATVKLTSIVVPSIEKTIELDPHQSRKTNNVLRFMGGGIDGEAGFDSRSLAYVSVIDRLANDPINLW